MITEQGNESKLHTFLLDKCLSATFLCRIGSLCVTKPPLLYQYTYSMPIFIQYFPLWEKAL